MNLLNESYRIDAKSYFGSGWIQMTRIMVSDDQSAIEEFHKRIEGLNPTEYRLVKVTESIISGAES